MSSSTCQLIFFLTHSTAHSSVSLAPHRDNLEDALGKLQEILDAAWKAVQPIEEDPEKKKKLEKQ